MMTNPNDQFLYESTGYYDALCMDYTHRSAFGQTITYMLRKQPSLSFEYAEAILRDALAVRSRSN